MTKYDPIYLTPFTISGRNKKHRLNAHASERQSHIARLHDLLIHLLSSAPSSENYIRAIRAWRYLAQCREIQMDSLLPLGAKLFSIQCLEGRDGIEENAIRNEKKADWLKWCQEDREEQVEKFNEYILALIAARQSQFAFNELKKCVIPLSLRN